MTKQTETAVKTAKTEKSFYQKLIEAKKNMGAIVKGSTNPFFKSKYADLGTILEVVEPELMEQGLILLQPIKEGVLYTIITDGTDKIEAGLELGNYTNPQDVGKEITYFRRYLLQSLLGLSAEDDDGNSLKRKQKSSVTIEQLTALLSEVKGKMTAEQVEYAERIIQSQEVASYGRAFEFMTKLKGGAK